MKVTAARLGWLLVVTAYPALAQDVAYDFRGCGTAESTVIDRAGDMVIVQGISRGIADSISSGGPFDKMTYECRSIAHASKQDVEFTNRCVFVDADGHKLMGTSTGSPKGWQWRFLAGTGKWEGIKGGGPGLPETAYARFSPSITGGCYRARGSYSLKDSPRQ